MMELEAIALVVAAVVGSTGLASLITGSLQLSRASRIKKAVHDMSEVVALHEPGSVEFDAAKYALKLLTFDLVALRLVRVGARVWWVLFGVIITLIGTLVLALPLADDVLATHSVIVWALLPWAGCYTALLVGGFVFLYSAKRENLVARMLEDGLSKESVLMISPSLGRRGTEKARGHGVGQNPLQRWLGLSGFQPKGAGRDRPSQTEASGEPAAGEA